MSAKADYTAEEWAQLSQAPLLATMAIVAADMSGPIGLVKEMMATVKTLQETSTSTTAGELVRTISTDVIESQQKKKDQKDEGAAGAQPEGAQPAGDATSADAADDALQNMKIDAKNPDEARQKAVEGCVAAANIVTQKSPAEADEFKQWLMTIANRTAEAAKEGGFLGIGGTQVSDKEKAGLAALATALGVSAA